MLSILIVIVWSILSSVACIHYFEEYGDEEILIPFCIHAAFGPIIILIYLFEFIFKLIKKKDDTKTL